MYIIKYKYLNLSKREQNSWRDNELINNNSSAIHSHKFAVQHVQSRHVTVCFLVLNSRDKHPFVRCSDCTKLFEWHCVFTCNSANVTLYLANWVFNMPWLHITTSMHNVLFLVIISVYFSVVFTQFFVSLSLFLCVSCTSCLPFGNKYCFCMGFSSSLCFFFQTTNPIMHHKLHHTESALCSIYHKSLQVCMKLIFSFSQKLIFLSYLFQGKCKFQSGK